MGQRFGDGGKWLTMEQLNLREKVRRKMYGPVPRGLVLGGNAIGEEWVRALFEEKVKVSGIRERLRVGSLWRAVDWVPLKPNGPGDRHGLTFEVEEGSLVMVVSLEVIVIGSNPLLEVKLLSAGEERVGMIYFDGGDLVGEREGWSEAVSSWEFFFEEAESSSSG